MGLADTARGDYSLAIGYKTRAQTYYSTAAGAYTTASGWYSTAMGGRTTASGYGSVAMGYYSIASKNYSTAIGSNSTASGDKSIAMGYNATALHNGCIAIGSYAKSSGDMYGSTAIGQNTTASGRGSIAMGTITTASGNFSTALGDETKASGIVSTAMGIHTTASGYYSTSIGSYTLANTYLMVSMGRYNDTTKYNGLNSYSSWYDNDPLFVIGNGTGTSSRSNALTVLKNGMIGLQTVTSPTYALQLPNSTTPGVGRAQANAWVTYSDARVKSDQQKINYGLQEILELQPKQYIQHNSDNYIESIEIDPGIKTIGLIAQEVYNIIPEVVSKPTDENQLWGVDYNKIVPVLVKGIQEQQQQINSQQEQIESQQQEIDELKSLVKSLIDNQTSQVNSK
jgi:hypothetical protein